jgi:hypothetical protein
MTEHAGPEVETLTIRIPMRLERRGGRKLIITPEGAALGPRKATREDTMVAGLLVHRPGRAAGSDPRAAAVSGLRPAGAERISARIGASCCATIRWALTHH